MSGVITQYARRSPVQIQCESHRRACERIEAGSASKSTIPGRAQRSGDTHAFAYSPKARSESCRALAQAHLTSGAAHLVISLRLSVCGRSGKGVSTVHRAKRRRLEGHATYGVSKSSSRDLGTDSPLTDRRLVGVKQPTWVDADRLAGSRGPRLTRWVVGRPRVRREASVSPRIGHVENSTRRRAVSRGARRAQEGS